VWQAIEKSFSRFGASIFRIWHRVFRVHMPVFSRRVFRLAVPYRRERNDVLVERTRPTSSGSQLRPTDPSRAINLGQDGSQDARSQGLSPADHASERNAWPLRAKRH
jgi:hypothetical protein